MGDRINVGLATLAVSNGLRAGTRTASASLRLDQARGRLGKALDRHEDRMVDAILVQRAQRDLREMLGL